MRRAALICLTALIGCSGKVENVASKADKPPRVPREVTAATSAGTAAITGKVVETMNAGGYTYLRIATASGDVWAAVRETNVTTGTSVTVAPQMIAENFESKTLNRKFDRLVMGSLAGGEATTAPPATANTKVEKAEGGITIADAWAGKSQLKDRPVVIRGKVVKFLPGIMGKNWIHLRDGSTDQDITVTTGDVAKIGDVVTARGTLHLDKDFGAGYVYPIIVEDGRLGQ